MFKGTFLFILCTLCLISIVLNFTDAGTNHKKSDPLYHEDLSATTNFKALWNYMGLGPFKVLWYAAGRVDAPSNSDGEYEVYAWVDGDNLDYKKQGYLGGITTGAYASVVKYIWENPPNHIKKALIKGNFLVGSPGNIIVHTPNIDDHQAKDD